MKKRLIAAVLAWAVTLVWAAERQGQSAAAQCKV